MGLGLNRVSFGKIIVFARTQIWRTHVGELAILSKIRGDGRLERVAGGINDHSQYTVKKHT